MSKRNEAEESSLLGKLAIWFFLIVGGVVVGGVAGMFLAFYYSGHGFDRNEHTMLLFMCCGTGAMAGAALASKFLMIERAGTRRRRERRGR